MSLPREKPSYPDGLFNWIGALLLGIGLPCLMGLFELVYDVPHTRRGSDFTNGLILIRFQILAVVGAVVGAFLGELLGLILFAIAWLRARRS